MTQPAFDLNTWMKPFWEKGETDFETVMLIGEEKEIPLLYRPSKILSVRSYDLTQEYEEGKDYVLKDGKLFRTENSALDYIPEELYYSRNKSAPGIVLHTLRNGEAAETFYAEDIAKYQISVSYLHEDSFGYIPADQSAFCASFLKKLEKGEDVTLFFYGDSITFGASSSSLAGISPMSPTWAIQFTLSLAKKYDYSVRYIDTGIAGVPPVPNGSVSGNRGNVTYVNTAVGGWAAIHGIQKYDEHIRPYIDRYGADFFLLGFGMNDAFNTPETEHEQMKTIADKVLSQAPDCTLVLLSTMVPNPEAVNGWYGNQHLFEPMMEKMAEDYRKQGVSCVLAPLTSVSKKILEKKRFRDYTGNNINHPNDFMARIYAQVIFRTVFGS